MSDVLTSIIEGVLEDLDRRSIPMAQLQAQLRDAGHLRGAKSALTGIDMKIISEAVSYTHLTLPTNREV